MRPTRTLKTPFFETGAWSFISWTSTPSIQTMSRPFSNGCSTANRMRLFAASLADVAAALALEWVISGDWGIARGVADTGTVGEAAGTVIGTAVGGMVVGATGAM